MSQAVTIDRIGIDAHKRYAYDQAHLDRRYLVDTTHIPIHSEVTATSTIYSSKWEELFGLHHQKTSWACFPPPPGFRLKHKRIFLSQLLPFIKTVEEEEEDENSSYAALIEKTKTPASLLAESQKSTLLAFFQHVKSLDELLGEVHSKKLQYQKG